MKISKISVLPLLLAFLPITSNAAGEDDVIVFTAPPRGTLIKETSTYKPIADFLSKALNKKVVYKQPLSWMHYQRDMWDDKIQIAFDGPHFVSWRMNNTGHTPLVKLPQPHVWAVIARKNDKTTNNIHDIQARSFCGHPPPNFGTLTIRSLVDSVTKEPKLVIRKGWKTIFNSIVDEQACYSGVVPLTNLSKYDPGLTKVKVIYTHPPYPNQALTINSHFSSDFREKVRDLLLSKEGQIAMGNLRQRFTKGKYLVPANKREYLEVSDVLKNVYGYGFNFKSGTAK